MGKEKRPLQSERINRYLFCFWFQVIRQDDLSNRDFPQFLLHPVAEAERLCRTAGFPPIIYSDHSVGVLYHIAVSVGVDAWKIFFLNDNNLSLIHISPDKQRAENLVGRYCSKYVLCSLPHIPIGRCSSGSFKSGT